MSEKLNAEQQSAVETINGPLLVLAGAGSGKTRVVTFRIAELLKEGIMASQILGLTFTNKAAGEMQARIRSLTQSNVIICTFHSLGVRILRESIDALGYRCDFTIYDEEDVNKLIKACMENIPGIDTKKEVKHWRHKISGAKNKLLTPEEADKTELGFRELYSAYQTRLQSYQAVDFDDLLFLTVRLFREHPAILEKYQQRWSHLLIDEYQDTNEAQYSIARCLVAKSQNICVVGDPDQAIYSWRGANIANILNFESDFPNAKVVRLERNYRSHSNILQAANALIVHNTDRYKKDLWSDLGAGEKIKQCRCDTELTEANFVVERIMFHHNLKQTPLKDIVVFYRTNAQSRVFEDQLRKRRIPYTMVGGLSFYSRKEIKDILAFLRMVQSESDYLAFLRTINLPKRGIGESTVEKLRDAAEQENCPILSYCQSLIEGKSNIVVKLPVKQKEGLKQYLEIIGNLRKINEFAPLPKLVEEVIIQSHYLDYIAADKETYNDRKENLSSLISKAMEWELTSPDCTLEAFLEELSLKSSLDESSDKNNCVSLMTIHNGKGLEFPVTFLVGIEEGLFPHINVGDDLNGIEEERRLCYVGMTRAKEHLYLSHAQQRFMWGTVRKQRRSRFLREIPSEYIESISQDGKTILPPSPKTSFVPQSQDDQFMDEQSISHSNPHDTGELFSIGEMIFHQQYGIGKIQGISTSQESIGPIYQIFFTKDNCEKSIAAKYASLKGL